MASPSVVGTSNDQSRTVEITADVKDALKKFRFTHQRGNAAISSGSSTSDVTLPSSCNANTSAVKIVKSSLTMAVDEEFVDVSVEEIAEGECLLNTLANLLRATRECAPPRPPFT